MLREDVSSEASTAQDVSSEPPPELSVEHDSSSPGGSSLTAVESAAPPSENRADQTAESPISAPEVDGPLPEAEGCTDEPARRIWDAFATIREKRSYDALLAELRKTRGDAWAVRFRDRVLEAGGDESQLEELAGKVEAFIRGNSA